MYRCFLKPLADYTGCLLLLPLALPLLLLGAVLSGISFGFGNMLFVQTRAGYRGSIFRLYKLTTMRPGPQPDAVRLTKTGLFLRRTSLDELPQFINVLCGQMSLVGPRPLLPEYLPLYSATVASAD